MTDPGMFSVTDACPVCHKRCKDMAAEHAGKFIYVMGAFIVCIRCGTVFMPPSRIKHVFTSSESKIIDPNSPEAKKIIEEVTP